MKMRTLGRSPLKVAPLAFGGNVFGWTADEATSFALLDAFVDAGFNLVDTADVYSYWVPGHRGGESETVLGKWLKRSGNRERVVLATKLGKPMGPDLQGLSPVYIARAVEASLQRLQTDYIDLYQAHDDDAQTPLADTLGAFSRLIEQGKVRVIGASNYSAARFGEALAVAQRHLLPRYETLQPEYNLYERFAYERDYAPLLASEQVGVIPYFALASGFLTGKYRSAADFAGRARAGMLSRYDQPRGWRIVEALHDVAARSGATPTQLAIAWQLARPEMTAPIASATTLTQLGELLKAATLELSAADRAALDDASRED
ncbi:aldo/keto reductase [Solimonas marina]|uniref:Aldo/keto reductase n=1 Tax=Solimonas marina TaxID=2714601 RepID=A0A969W7X1_9GAMM|nr:aldo/keto reductase [Solimonas marina]NKF22262.1 aldo/keto reductase [Solimonas marina]